MACCYCANERCNKQMWIRLNRMTRVKEQALLINKGGEMGKAIPRVTKTGPNKKPENE